MSRQTRINHKETDVWLFAFLFAFISPSRAAVRIPKDKTQKTNTRQRCTSHYDVLLIKLLKSFANFLLLSHLLSCNCCSLLAEKRKWTRRPEDGETRRKNSESCPLAGFNVDEIAGELDPFMGVARPRARFSQRCRKNRHAIPSCRTNILYFFGFLLVFISLPMLFQKAFGSSARFLSPHLVFFFLSPFAGL